MIRIVFEWVVFVVSSTWLDVVDEWKIMVVICIVADREECHFAKVADEVVKLEDVYTAAFAFKLLVLVTGGLALLLRIAMMQLSLQGF